MECLGERLLCLGKDFLERKVFNFFYIIFNIFEEIYVIFMLFYIKFVLVKKVFKELKFLLYNDFRDEIIIFNNWIWYYLKLVVSSYILKI